MTTLARKQPVRGRVQRDLPDASQASGSRGALVYFDNRGVDGAVTGMAAGLGGGSSRLRRTQSGFVRSYALSMLGGTVAVVAVLLAVRYQ